jgi:hypothetical protein
MQQTLFPWNLYLFFRTAATTVADDGSITSFILSNTSFVASIIYSSLTNRRFYNDRFSLIIPKVKLPKLVLKPSAMETGGY